MIIFNSIETVIPRDDTVGVYKVVINAGDYPDKIPPPAPLTSGDTLCICDSKPVKIGDKYKNCPAKVIKIFYEPKKWWQIFKKKKQLGYIVKWT